MSKINEKLRLLPKTDEVMQHRELETEIEQTGRELVLEAVRNTIDDLRQTILAGKEKLEAGMDIDIDVEAVIRSVKCCVKDMDRRNLRRVINGTGIVLHTNLGRARLSDSTAAAIAEAAANYSNLEYDLGSGQRGSRHQHISALAAKITGAEDAMVVNNNASAVALCLAALAKDKEVIVSRGELVEIGGAFRVPEIMEQSGATLVEVGTTNKTKAADYSNAVNENTGALLKVHTSNYRIIGFTEEVSLQELTQIGEKSHIPVLYDLGSGLMMDLRKYGLDEPTVYEGIAGGADVVMFSGDKLFGGPQAGIIVGKKEYIDKMKKHPMARIVRSDKLTLAGLEETFRVYLDKERAAREIPVLRMITAEPPELKDKAERLLDTFGGKLADCTVTVEESLSQVGGGSAPMMDIPSYALYFAPHNMSVDQLEKRLRANELPIISRIYKERLLLDVRTIDEKEFEEISKALLAIFL